MEDDDHLSTRTPTQSELQTFQVLANKEFTNFGRSAPTRAAMVHHQQLQEVRSEASRPAEAHHDGHRGPSPARSERAPSVGHASVGRESGWGGLLRGDSPASYEVQREPERYADDGRREADREVARDEGTQEPYREHSAEPERREPSTEPLRRDGGHGADSRDSSLARRHAAETSGVEWARAKKDAELDIAIEKEALLYELELMERQGSLQLHRKLTMDDSLEAIQYQYDRANMMINTQQTVEWAKSGIKMGSSILEMGLKRFGISVVDGFSKNLCQDMTRFNRPLTKMYRKYWRRGTSSPEMELAMIVFGALAMTVVTNSNLLGNLLGGKAPSSGGFAGLAAPAGPALGSAALGGAPQAAPSGGPQSALKGPSNVFGSPSAQPAGPVVGAPAAKIPDWAKAAIAAGPPPPPQHFAKASVEPYPIRSAPPPVLMAPARIMESQMQPVTHLEAVQHAPVAPQALTTPAAPLATAEAAPETNVRRLTLNSPVRSSRRRREPVAELNLDD